MTELYPYLVGYWDKYKHNIKIEDGKFTYDWRKHEPNDEEFVAVIPVKKLEELIKLAQK